MRVKYVIAAFVEHPNQLVLARQYGIHEILTLYRRDNHIIDLIFASVIILIDDL